MLVITINHSHAGFFAYVNFVLNQLRYAERHGLRPVVHFGPHSGDGPNAFYDPGRGESTWDYYFEPVANLSYADLEARIADPDDPLSREDLVKLSSKELWRIHNREPESVFPYPHGMHHRGRHDEEWYSDQRRRGRRLVQRYVRVKPHVLAKVDAFAREHFEGAHVLGVHMRGTDKGAAHAPPELMRVVTPKEYFPHIDAYTDRNGPCRIFVATDQQQFVEQMRRRYGDRIVCYEAIRTRGRRNPVQLDDGNGYRKGEDVLIDCLLLSRCNYLLKCTSAVGEFAMYLNPDLECTDLNHAAAPISGIRSLAVRMKRKAYGRYLKRKRRAYRRRRAR